MLAFFAAALSIAMAVMFYPGWVSGLAVLSAVANIGWGVRDMLRWKAKAAAHAAALKKESAGSDPAA